MEPRKQGVKNWRVIFVGTRHTTAETGVALDLPIVKHKIDHHRSMTKREASAYAKKYNLRDSQVTGFLAYAVPENRE